MYNVHVDLNAEISLSQIFSFIWRACEDLTNTIKISCLAVCIDFQKLFLLMELLQFLTFFVLLSYFLWLRKLLAAFQSMNVLAEKY